jgi:ATP-binding cassette subfamily C protein LapB
MLFFGSLKNNLLLGNPPVSDVELLNAIRIGGVDSFAHLHPSGLDMPVGERGELLSTGQRQSVLIARAVLKNPAILLMDEPTASMDSATEERVRRNLAAFSQGRTLLVITHKTALLELVDRIIVLEGGRIVADGSKEAVLRALQQGPARDKK